jgi:hypothetical protein
MVWEALVRPPAARRLRRSTPAEGKMCGDDWAERVGARCTVGEW